MYFIEKRIHFVVHLENPCILVTPKSDNPMKTITTLALALFVSFNTFAQISSSEKQALVDIYTKTNGSSWTNSWDMEQSPKSWKGVVVLNNKVIALTLNDNNLTGELPESIGNLTSLKVLNLHKNNITGTIPQSITGIKGLKVLNISFNKLEGTLPTHLTDLASLEYLDLFFNNLTGELPADLGNLKNLKRISLYSNNFEGKLPASIQELQKLRDIQISSNNFNGELPVGIASLNSLKRLSIFDNKFSGEFPEMINTLDLQELAYQNNKFNPTTLVAVSDK